MNIDFLSPIKDTIVAHSVLLPPQSFGKSIAAYTNQEGFPDLDRCRNSNFRCSRR